ncbi:MAG: hypothetical protein LBQ28_03690 [Prevotellaceae bacterium]|jgi:hypothetical protein|nr:hypothetical protein [Prevotellaceae bacterium]
MKKIIFYFTAFLFILGSNSCGKKTDKPAKAEPKQLNISILLDLSDRISPNIHPAIPSHKERDIEIIKIITEYFKKDMEKRTAWKAKGRIKVFFTPPPADPEINNIANKLKIDCSNMNNQGRKNIYDSISYLFTQNITNIYDKAINTNEWPGSDIWRFFNDNVTNYCVDRDTTYRNILIILTDGYIYHENSVSKTGNRYAYLRVENIARYRNLSYKEQINKDDFGLISTRNDLNNLEVLVLEISAEKVKNDENTLKYVIEKWLKEMNVLHSNVYSSDLPSNTKKMIEDFLDFK